MATKLFDDSEDESDGGVELKINNEYATRFEHNKKREEQHRLEEKFKSKHGVPAVGGDDDDDSSDDETEDEDGMLDTPDLDAQWNRTLQAIRNKDPRIYDSKTTFYAEKDDEAGAGDEASTKAKKEKPIFLKDYHRERLLAGDAGADDMEEEPPKTYTQEQSDLQKSIRDEIKAQLEGEPGDEADGDDDGEFIKAKEGALEKARAEVGLDEVHPSRVVKVNTNKTAKIKASNISVENADKDPELFLSNFLASRSWAQDDNHNQWEAFESDDGEDNLEKADEWEAAYNLRFEDPSTSNEVLKSYARDVAAAKSVRREDKTGRAKKREIEKEQKEAEKQQRREEKARLRKLKVEEAEGRLKQIKKAAGLSGKLLKEEDWVKFLNDEWENDQWEQEMSKTFGEQYYAEMEGGASGDEGREVSSKTSKKVKKPKWDDDIDIKDLVPDFEDDERPKFSLSDEEDLDGHEDGEVEVEAEDEDEDGQPAAKRQKTTKERKKERLASQKDARRERAKLEALVDAKIDMEDPDALAGSSKTTQGGAPRFAYRETWAESFGMNARDILMAPSDAALNEFVGLKKLAHFRPDDKKSKDKKRLGKKARLRQWRRETFGADAEKEGPAFSFGGPPAEDQRAEDEVPQGMDNVVDNNGATKKKRKRSGRKGKGVAA